MVTLGKDPLPTKTVNNGADGGISMNEFPNKLGAQIEKYRKYSFIKRHSLRAEKKGKFCGFAPG